MGQMVCPCGVTIYQKVEIFAIFGAVFPPPDTNWHEILLGQVDPCASWLCQISCELVQKVAPAGMKILIFGL